MLTFLQCPTVFPFSIAHSSFKSWKQPAWPLNFDYSENDYISLLSYLHSSPLLPVTIEEPSGHSSGPSVVCVSPPSIGGGVTFSIMGLLLEHSATFSFLMHQVRCSYSVKPDTCTCKLWIGIHLWCACRCFLSSLGCILGRSRSCHHKFHSLVYTDMSLAGIW